MKLEAALWKKLGWTEADEMNCFFALLWNVFNSSRRATKCSPPNYSADRLPLEIHFVWKQHSSYGERAYINTQAFSASAHISLLHFWLSRAIFWSPLLLSFSVQLPFSLQQSFFHSQALDAKGIRFSLMLDGFQRPRQSRGKWKTRNGDAMHDRGYLIFHFFIYALWFQTGCLENKKLPTETLFFVKSKGHV